MTLCYRINHISNALEKFYERGSVPALIHCLFKFMFHNQSCHSLNRGAGHQMHVFLRATGVKRVQRRMVHGVATICDLSEH